jgi:hypothetical protein
MKHRYDRVAHNQHFSAMRFGGILLEFGRHKLAADPIVRYFQQSGLGVPGH